MAIKLIVFDLDYTLHNGSSLFEGVQEAIEKYRESGMRVCVASYNRFAGVILRRYGVSHLFDFIIGGYLSYPKSVHLKSLLDLYSTKTKYSFTPDEIVFVDDMTDVCKELKNTYPSMRVINCDPSTGVDIEELQKVVHAS